LQWLDAELTAIPLNEAHQIGVGDAWIERLARKGMDRHTALQVQAVYTPMGVQEGDIVMAINDEPVTRALDIFAQEQSLCSKSTLKSVGMRLTISWGMGNEHLP
jgi:hypothetical protein